MKDRTGGGLHGCPAHTKPPGFTLRQSRTASKNPRTLQKSCSCRWAISNHCLIATDLRRAKLLSMGRFATSEASAKDLKVFTAINFICLLSFEVFAWA